jgi:hypothetical protein
MNTSLDFVVVEQNYYHENNFNLLYILIFTLTFGIFNNAWEIDIQYRYSTL